MLSIAVTGESIAILDLKNERALAHIRSMLTVSAPKSEAAHKVARRSFHTVRQWGKLHLGTITPRSNANVMAGNRVGRRQIQHAEVYMLSERAPEGLGKLTPKCFDLAFCEAFSLTWAAVIGVMMIEAEKNQIVLTGVRVVTVNVRDLPVL